MRCLAVALAAGALLLGCGEEADERENLANASSTSAASGSLSDAQLVGILNATIASSSAMAATGEARVTNGNVRDFVDFQSTSASNAKANVDRIAAELGITPEDSPFMSSIAASSTAQMSTLRGTADTGFDDAFLISVADAQSFTAATFADSFAGSGSTRVAALVNGMHDALELEAGFSRALQGDFDATDFLLEHRDIGGGAGGAGGNTGGSNDGGNVGGSPTGPGVDTGTDTGSGDNPGAGSGSDGGLGGDGTATGNGQDPGGAVGTGNPNADGDPTTTP